MARMTSHRGKKGTKGLRKSKEEVSTAPKATAFQRSGIHIWQYSFLKHVLCFLLVGLWLLSGQSVAQGARVAGEEGVTPAAPERPAPKPPARRPAAPETLQPPEKPDVAPSPPEVSQPPAKPPVKRPAEVKPPPKTPAPVRPVPVQQVQEPKPATPPAKEPSDARHVTIDFDDVDIALFIKFISELTKKNFVIDKAVRGKVTIVSPTKISVDEAYKVFESVLEVHGFATVPSGSVIKIVPAVAARSKSIETRIREEAIDPEDKIITQLIPLDYANPDELKKLFAPFISKSSVMVSYPPTGTLIVTDVLSNIKRLLSIVRAIDVVGIGEEISVIPLEYATASVLVKSLTSVFQTKVRRKGSPVTPPVKIVSDERTNSLIIAASENDTIKVKQLINLLDKEIPRGEGAIRVYYLQNANAEDLAQVLTALPAKQEKAPKKGKAPVISKEVQIAADKATNSLVITANKDDYTILEDVIQKLDIARRMVYIEALIMEVKVGDRFDLGAQWQVGDDIGSYEGRDVGGFASSTPPEGLIPVDPTTGAVSLSQGFSVGVLGESINIGGLQFPSIAAVIKAFQGDTDVHILSTPQIMTTDNEEAEIVVGENVPYLTRQETSDSGIDYSNYEFKDVGVTLKITPQINQERFVRLKIFQELTQVVEEAEIGLPTTLKRTAETTVIIQDKHTVVIGGLIDETLQQTDYRVPCLGSLPIFGRLFSSEGRLGGKTNLFIFLTPHIIENPTEATEIYEEKRETFDMERFDTIEEGVIKLYERPEGRGEESDVEGP
jgi:general secretion pathway protein D